MKFSTLMSSWAATSPRCPTRSSRPSAARPVSWARGPAVNSVGTQVGAPRPRGGRCDGAAGWLAGVGVREVRSGAAVGWDAAPAGAGTRTGRARCARDNYNTATSSGAPSSSTRARQLMPDESSSLSSVPYITQLIVSTCTIISAHDTGHGTATCAKPAADSLCD